MIYIGNKRHGDDGFYVGRPSPLGNPFVIGRHGTREEVVKEYRKYFLTMLETVPAARRQLCDIYEASLKGDVMLLCWCAPEACHAVIIKDHIEELVEELKE